MTSMVQRLYVQNLITSMVQCDLGPERLVSESVSASADLVPESAALVSEPRCSFRISPLSFRMPLCDQVDVAIVEAGRYLENM